MSRRHTIGLGGLGGDSHSVGLILLRWTLEKLGYNVVYLGIQNSISAFFDIAPFCNVVMVSCLDGHARHYLREFPALRNERQVKALWYLGGNPSVEKLYGGERIFMEMGFSQVFLEFVDLETVLSVLEKDTANLTPIPDVDLILANKGPRPQIVSEAVIESKIGVSDHDRDRSEVLQHWPTGIGAKSLRDNAEHLAKSPSLAAWEGNVLEGSRDLLLQPRSGVALVKDQIRYFDALAKAGANVLSFQIDSLTRNNNYAEAEHGIRESTIAGYSTINGYPAVNHGVEPLRMISKWSSRPLQFRHSTRDPRLLGEICFAGGVMAFEGGSICYNIPYYREYPLDRSITAWQYIDRLVGRYFDDYGLVIHREFFGVLTGTLVPPCIAIATGILECLLAAGQGVRAVAVGFAETGCRAQDVAALRSIPGLVKRYLDGYGFSGVHVGAIFNQYMAAFPLVNSKARDLIVGSGTTAKLGGATRILTKTAVEAVKIPSLADNLEGVALNLQGFGEAPVHIVDEYAVSIEMDMIEREVSAIVDKVIELGRGNIGAGVIRAFKSGVIDIPFAPSVYNAGKVMAARDITGAIRLLTVGNLPFGADVQSFHREKLSERRRTEGLKEDEDYRLVEQDLLRVARGQFERWPLDVNASRGAVIATETGERSVAQRKF